MRNDFGSRPYSSRFPYAKRAKKSTGGKSQGYNARLDESLGVRDGKKSQSFKLILLSQQWINHKERLWQILEE